MEEIKLIKPTLSLMNEFLDMIHDYEFHHEKPKPWTINLKADDFEAMIQTLEGYSNGIGLKENHAPHSTYWLVNQDRILGAVNIRHRLNEYLLKYDGHIGGAIRPSERNKGYATLMLKLALEITKTMGMKKVLITCNKGNEASERTIIKNGGIFESEEIEESGNIVRRFWIDLD